MNPFTMNPFIGRNPNASVAQSVSALVAEGGNVLASDDAPTVPRQTLLEAAMLANARQAASRFGAGQSSLLAPHRILLRASAQHRPTLHLPAGRAMTDGGKPGGQPRSRQPNHWPRARTAFGPVRTANGS